MATKKTLEGLLLQQPELDQLDLMLQEMPYKYANQIYHFLQDRITEGHSGKFVKELPISKSKLTYSKDFKYQRANNLAEELEPKNLNNGIPISRTQQSVQNY